jgi:hypothetical protein
MLGIINDDDATKKDRTEAAKLLARMHHALQVDRTTVKATATAGPNIEKEKQEEISQRIDEILSRDMSEKSEKVN